MPFKDLEKRKEYNKKYYQQLKTLRELQHKKRYKEKGFKQEEEKPNEKPNQEIQQNDNFFLQTLKTQSKNILLKGVLMLGGLLLTSSMNAMKKTLKMKDEKTESSNSKTEQEIFINPLD